MSEIQTTTTAKVRLTIEVDAGSTWGGKTDLDQVHRQAGTETCNRISALFAKEVRGMRIIGPEVLAVTTACKR